MNTISQHKPISKTWVVKEFGEEQVEALRKKLPIHPAFCKLLIMRGITTYDDAQRFFRPSLEELHDPFLMKNMDTAVERLHRAIEHNENILVYGDYDVDGTTSVSLLYLFLQNYTANLNYYTPHRYREGYGISIQSIDWAAENDIDLVIALDCGIKDVSKIEYANKLGVDFIICDHHLPGQIVPAAIAVLDPKQENCRYPFKELSGCGIGFKLAEGYQSRYGKKGVDLESYLDLLVISIAADIVPMLDENRVLAYHGLKRLNNEPRLGLAALMDIAGLERTMVDKTTGEVQSRKITISDIVFKMGPRINAAGRMDDATAAIKLLISATADEAKENARVLHQANESRVELDKQITMEAIDLVLKEDAKGEKSSIVLFNPDWHKGVVGIVASRVVEHFYKPTILLAESDGIATGSARSVDDFNIYDAIESCSDVLDRFGGHKYAAGLSLKVENLALFKEKFEVYVSTHIKPESRKPKLWIDSTLEFSDITPAFYKLLEQFAPFGPGNIHPKFVSSDVQNSGYSKIVGNNHLKLAVKQHGKDMKYGIAFGQGSYLEPVSAGKTFEICYALRENTWNGRTNIELDVKDLKFAESNFTEK